MADLNAGLTAVTRPSATAPSSDGRSAASTHRSTTSSDARKAIRVAHGAGSTMIRSTVGRPANGPSVPGRSVAGMPEAGAGQQRVGLGQRQADDVRVGSVEEGHVGGRDRKSVGEGKSG